MNEEAVIQSYFSEAASWDADRAAQAIRSARRAWLVAAVGWLSTVLSITALMLLMPLKRVDPFVVRVDNSTGLVDVVPVYAGTSKLPEAVVRYLLDHYVTICERFNFSTAESDYEECGAFNTPQRNQLWYTHWSKGNPDSPLNVYKDGSSVRAQVRSVSFFTRADGTGDLAQVRYMKTKRSAGGTDEQRTYWIATIQYAFGEPSKDAKVRRWNPLGFKVVEFREEPEAFTPAETKTTDSSHVLRNGVAQ